MPSIVSKTTGARSEKYGCVGSFIVSSMFGVIESCGGGRGARELEGVW